MSGYDDLQIVLVKTEVKVLLLNGCKESILALKKVFTFRRLYRAANQGNRVPQCLRILLLHHKRPFLKLVKYRNTVFEELSLLLGLDLFRQPLIIRLIVKQGTLIVSLLCISDLFLLSNQISIDFDLLHCGSWRVDFWLLYFPAGRLMNVVRIIL